MFAGVTVHAAFMGGRACDQCGFDPAAIVAARLLHVRPVAASSSGRSKLDGAARAARAEAPRSRTASSTRRAKLRPRPASATNSPHVGKKPQRRGDLNCLTIPAPTCKNTCMSTKTIAVDSRVYERLASAKREGESFSKTIDRLLTQLGAAHTGGEILRELEDIPALTQDDATAFLRVIDEARRDEDWNRRR
jgi:predicted CopG family antitoxin